ncbi:MAG: hypothetical protein JO079_03425 [Frankiaceae bacterium]|nr:hypothetical protein [Frankiaceae bacterium]
MQRISTALLGGAVLGAALLVACGGGGGSSGSGAPAGLPPVATNPPAGSPQSFSASDAVAIPSAAPGAATVPVALPSDPSGASANAALPSNGSIPPDATIAATYTSTADPSLPALARSRSVQGRTVRDDTKKDIVAYLKLQFSADVTLPQAPAFSFVVPRTLPTAGVTYWLAFLDPLRTAAGWQLGFEGPATVTATTTASGKAATQLAFASNGQPITFTANQTYYFAVVGVSTVAATPTPVPSSVPSNPPPDPHPASMGVTPRNLQFADVTSTPAPITFVQQGFTGAFTLHGDCTGIVNTSGASPTFTVTPIGPGRCVIIGLGDRGATAVVHVGVVTPYETPHPTASPTAQPSHTPYPTYPPTTAPTGEPSHTPYPTYPPTTAPSRSPEPTHAPTTAPTATPGSNVSPSPNPSQQPH